MSGWETLVWMVSLIYILIIVSTCRWLHLQQMQHFLPALWQIFRLRPCLLEAFGWSPCHLVKHAVFVPFESICSCYCNKSVFLMILLWSLVAPVLHHYFEKVRKKPMTQDDRSRNREEVEWGRACAFCRPITLYLYIYHLYHTCDYKIASKLSC